MKQQTFFHFGYFSRTRPCAFDMWNISGLTRLKRCFCAGRLSAPRALQWSQSRVEFWWMAAVLIELQHIKLLWGLKEWIAVDCFVTPKVIFILSGLVSVLALLGVDCAVAMGNAHMVQFSCSLCVWVCVSVYECACVCPCACMTWGNCWAVIYILTRSSICTH